MRQQGLLFDCQCWSVRCFLLFLLFGVKAQEGKTFAAKAWVAKRMPRGELNPLRRPKSCVSRDKGVTCLWSWGTSACFSGTSWRDASMSWWYSSRHSGRQCCIQGPIHSRIAAALLIQASSTLNLRTIDGGEGAKEVIVDQDVEGLSQERISQEHDATVLVGQVLHHEDGLSCIIALMCRNVFLALASSLFLASSLMLSSSVPELFLHSALHCLLLCFVLFLSVFSFFVLLPLHNLIVFPLPQRSLAYCLVKKICIYNVCETSEILIILSTNTDFTRDSLTSLFREILKLQNPSKCLKRTYSSNIFLSSIAIKQSINQSINLSIYRYLSPSLFVMFIKLSTYLIYLSIYLSVYLVMFLFMSISIIYIYISIYPYVCMYVYIYMCVCVCCNDG